MPELSETRPIQSPASPRPTGSGEAKPLDVTTKIGLWIVAVLIMMIVMLRFPELGALVERYNQF